MPKKNSPSDKHRSYFITVNNYEEFYDDILNDTRFYAKYFVIGKEVGKEGTPHIHVFVQYKNPRVWNAILGIFGKGSEIIADFKGPNAIHNIIEYCKKDGDYIEEGEPPVQGKRTDYENTRQVVIENPDCPMREVVRMAPNLQSIKVAEQYLKYHEKKRNWKPVVKWFYGPTGSGKTYQAHQECEDPFVWEIPKWWDGYDAHAHVIIDEFRKDFCTFHNLLRILDRYAHRVETKGGMRSLLATKIIITCPYHPKDVYATREDIQQLLRRIDEIKKFEYTTEDGEILPAPQPQDLPPSSSDDEYDPFLSSSEDTDSLA